MPNRNIRFRLTQGVARMTLGRPDKRNVLSRDTLLEIRDALYQVEKASACLFILDAEGPVFSSGGDLTDPLTHAGDLAILLKDFYHPILRALVAVQCPTVCVVDGLVVGGACGLVLASDMVIATQDARFVFPFAQMGLVPDCGLSWLLPRIVGPTRARSLLLFGETLEADEAYQIGMVSRRVEAGDLSGYLTGLVNRVRDLDCEALIATKKSLGSAETGSLAQSLADERAAQQRAGRSTRFADTLVRYRRQSRAELTD